jgi:hypothetical protein
MNDPDATDNQEEPPDGSRRRRIDSCSDPRTKAVMGALVKHLHALAREIELTDEEWFVGIDFLTRTGKFFSGSRQEFVLLSDVLGLSMLTVGLSDKKPAGATSPSLALSPPTRPDRRPRGTPTGRSRRTPHEYQHAA